MKIFDPQLTGSIEVENPISGSVTTLGNVIALGSDSSLTGSFTGSFKGDGSALVGVIVDSGSWDGIFTGSAAISGSLNISGAEAIQLTVEKRIRGQYYSVYNSTAATYAGYLITSGDFEDDATTDLGLASGTGRNIRFYTANNPVEKMRLTTDGQVRIGNYATTNGILDVQYDASVYNAPRISDTRSYAINNGGGIDFMGRYSSTDTQTKRFGSIYGKKENATNNNTDGYLEFQTNNVERMRISSTGALTLTASANSTGAPRAIGFGGNSIGTNPLIYYDNAGNLVIDSKTSSKVYLNGDVNGDVVLGLGGGSVGIGTASPAELLEVKASSSPAIQINQNDQYKSIIRLAGNDLEIRGSSGAMEFYNGSADGDSSALVMSISSGGDTTITTTTNQGGLTITSATDNTTLRLVNTNASASGQDWRFYSTGGSSGLGVGKLFIKVGTTETAARLISFVDGGSDIKMGIGTATPSRLLQVGGSSNNDGDVQIGGTNSSLGLRLAYDQSGSTIASIYNQYNGNTTSKINFGFGTTLGSNIVLSLVSGGEVAIGNSNPETDWYTASGGGYASLQMGQSSFLAAYKSDDSVELSQNSYFSSAGVPKGITASVDGARITLVDGAFIFQQLQTLADVTQPQVGTNAWQIKPAYQGRVIQQEDYNWSFGVSKTYYSNFTMFIVECDLGDHAACIVSIAGTKRSPGSNDHIGIKEYSCYKTPSNNWVVTQEVSRGVNNDLTFSVSTTQINFISPFAGNNNYCNYSIKVMGAARANSSQQDLRVISYGG